MPPADPRESRRLAALRAYEILDTPREPEFDDIVQMAAQACDTPMAQIGFLDAHRHWFKAEIGLGVREWPREPGIGAQAPGAAEILVLPDLALDPAHASHPLVTGPPHLRFYAGVPLLTREGVTIGTLCVLDRVPRRLSDRQVSILRALARTVTRQMEMRRTDAALRASEARLGASQARQGFLLRLADTMLALDDPHAIMRVAVEALGKHLGVSRVGYGRVQADDRTILRLVSYTDQVRAPDGALDMGRFGTQLLERQRGGETMAVADVAAAPGFDPAVWEAVDTRAFLSVPLMREGRFSAALYVTHHAPRPWASDEVALVEDVAARTWEAVERAQAEAELRRRATYHRQILDSAVDYAIFATDRAGRITEWSEGARRIFGWSEAEMLGQSAERLFTPEDRAQDRIGTEMRLALSMGAGDDERWHLRRSGARFWASGELTPLRDGAGVTIGFVKVLRDLTDDRLAREALDAALRRQEIALDTGRVGFFDWDVERSVVRGDTRFAALFGADARAMEAGVPIETLMDRVHPADAEGLRASLAKSLETRDDYTHEYRIVRPAGTCWVVVRGRCYASAAGRPLHYAGTVIDISEQRATQVRLRESEERYRSLFNSIDAGFCIIEMIFDGAQAVDYRFVEVNPAFERQTGLRGVLGRTVRELVPGHERHWFDAYGQVARTGQAIRFEDTAKALGERWYDVYAFRSGAPEAARVAVLFNDVSDRRRLEVALRRLNEGLESEVAARTAERDRVWKNSRDLLAILDLSGVFRAVNPAWEANLGLSPESLVGRCFLDFVDAGDVERSRAGHERAGRGPLSSFENGYRHADGGVRTISWQTSLEGGSIYAYGRDVTAERERQAELDLAQESLRQSQKMEAVGQLTGGVAHDFNNLLTIIRSSVDFLRRPDLPEERRRRYMDAVSDTVDRAAKLTGQLLAFARRQALKPEVFDVGVRLMAVSDMLDTLTGARISVVTHVPDPPCFVRADLSQFETALVNMAVNARDAMEGAGTLTLRLTCTTEMPALRGHAPARGAFAAIALSDTGSGIPADRIGHIFEPFFTTKEVGRGTGLGLSQVFGFAKQSGGDVSVASTPGAGTTFTLYLPEIADEPSAVPRIEGDPRPGPDGAGQSVLVVEDNIEVGRFATQILEDLGYRTALAANAEDALTRLGADGAGFEVVFSDVVMPGMGGLALAEELRRRLPGLPVILTSGYSHVLAQEGAHGFELLHKPYSAEQLSRLLRRVTPRRRKP